LTVYRTCSLHKALASSRADRRLDLGSPKILAGMIGNRGQRAQIALLPGCALGGGQTARAIPILKRAIYADPSNLQAEAALGSAYLMTKIIGWLRNIWRGRWKSGRWINDWQSGAALWQSPK